MQFSWTRRALRDLDRLEDFLIQKNPRAAARAVAAILDATRMLRDFPQAGRPADDLDPEHRELLVPFSTSGYVVRYRLTENTIEILDVRHQREGAD